MDIYLVICSFTVLLLEIAYGICFQRTKPAVMIFCSRRWLFFTKSAFNQSCQETFGL